MNGLKDIASFGKVEAEQDAILDYFVEMSITENVDSNDTFLILGRKGSGKTALFRYFTEQRQVGYATALNLNGYPWKIHEAIKDDSVEPVESYVASWRYLITLEFAKKIIELSDRCQMKEYVSIEKFLSENYGSSTPSLKDIFTPSSLTISGDLEPQILGCKLGKISFSNVQRSIRLGNELDALTDKIITSVVKIANASNIEKITLHFDELDRGITYLEESRKNLIIGLILASKSMNIKWSKLSVTFKSNVYLRTDIWDELKFSDKNKVAESNADFIEWNHERLHGLIEKRIRVLLGAQYSWTTIDDGKKINKQPKWKHIIDRTLMRPRDVISFLNTLLEVAKKRDRNVSVFENKDVVEARQKYSNYLKKELDDEILAHWKDWEVCLQALSRIGKVYFTKSDYQASYASITSSKTYSEEQSLEQLYNFSVIEYEARSGYGGSGWKSKFANPELGWDSNATRFKVHLGLKEYMKLKEERSSI